MDWLICAQTFIHVAEQRNLTAVAKLMLTTPPSITKRLQWLENEVQAVLLQRTTRTVLLTEQGQILYQQLKPLLAEWEKIQSNLCQTQMCGELSIAASPSFSKVFFVSLLAKFKAENPGLTFSLKNILAPISLMQEGIDVFVGSNHYIREEHNTVKLPFVTFERQFFASPGYLQKRGRPQDLQDLAQHDCVHLTDKPEWVVNGELCSQGVVSFVSNNHDALISAAKHDFGIVYTPATLIEAELASGELLPVLEGHQGELIDYYLFYPKLTYMPAKIRAFLDFMKAQKLF